MGPVSPCRRRLHRARCRVFDHLPGGNPPPVHSWTLAVLIGLSALVVTLVGRPEDAITAAITTAVVMVVAEVSPHHAWQQPILRFADTVIGVAVGIAGAWISLRVIRPRIKPTS